MYKYLHSVVYAVSGLIGFVLFATAYPQINGNLTQWYGGVAMIYLYIVLCISPLYYVFPDLPFKHGAIHIRKSLGISSCIFSLLHAYFGYKFVGGFYMLRYFGPSYNWSILFGMIALIILVVMAITSKDSIHRALGAVWKKIHRLIYPGGILILFHIFLVTTHLGNNEFLFSVIGFILLSILCILESFRLQDAVGHAFVFLPGQLISRIVSVVSVMILYWAFFILYHPH